MSTFPSTSSFSTTWRLPHRSRCRHTYAATACPTAHPQLPLGAGRDATDRGKQGSKYNLLCEPRPRPRRRHRIAAAEPSAAAAATAEAQEVDVDSRGATAAPRRPDRNRRQQRHADQQHDSRDPTASAPRDRCPPVRDQRRQRDRVACLEGGARDLSGGLDLRQMQSQGVNVGTRSQAPQHEDAQPFRGGLRFRQAALDRGGVRSSGVPDPSRL